MDRIKHTAIMRKVEAELMDAGYDVYNEVWFTIEGQYMDFAGRCDIVAIKEDRGIICEVKSSKNKYDSDRTQLLLYIWGLPKSKGDRFKGIVFDGIIVYEHDRVEVAALEVDEIFCGLLKDYIQDTLVNEPSHKRPSYFECKYCNIADCDERQLEEDRQLGETTYKPDFF